MIRLVVGIVLLIAAVLWLPVWVQLALFAAAIIVVPYRFFLIVPAIVSDALYSSHGVWNFNAHWMTLIVLAMLALHYFIMKKLRIRTLYGLEA
jgi:hypothetical protein